MDKELIKTMRQAIKENDLEAIRKLIHDNEGVINTVTPLGTFLHMATSSGMYDVVKFLLENGIDVNIKGGIRDSSAMTIAAFKGYMDICELLYDNGAQLDVSDFDRNPLFAAIYNGHYDIVKFLVEKGIDTKASYAIGDLDSCDAYEYARQYGRTEIADYLKEINKG